jgi:hypothetical protein
VAIIRIAVPYTGMILSTRESAEMRDELLKVRQTATVAACGMLHFIMSYPNWHPHSHAETLVAAAAVCVGFIYNPSVEWQHSSLVPLALARWVVWCAEDILAGTTSAREGMTAVAACAVAVPSRLPMYCCFTCYHHATYAQLLCACRSA